MNPSAGFAKLADSQISETSRAALALVTQALLAFVVNGAALAPRTSACAIA